MAEERTPEELEALLAEAEKERDKIKEQVEDREARLESAEDELTAERERADSLDKELEVYSAEGKTYEEQLEDKMKKFEASLSEANKRAEDAEKNALAYKKDLLRLDVLADYPDANIAEIVGETKEEMKKAAEASQKKLLALRKQIEEDVKKQYGIPLDLEPPTSIPSGKPIPGVKTSPEELIREGQEAEGLTNEERLLKISEGCLMKGLKKIPAKLSELLHPTEK